MGILTLGTKPSLWFQNRKNPKSQLIDWKQEIPIKLKSNQDDVPSLV